MKLDPDRIRERAYDIWMAEGCPENKDDEHWIRAESELLAGDGNGNGNNKQAPSDHMQIAMRDASVNENGSGPEIDPDAPPKMTPPKHQRPSGKAAQSAAS